MDRKVPALQSAPSSCGVFTFQALQPAVSCLQGWQGYSKVEKEQGCWRQQAVSIWVCRTTATHCGAAINSHRSHIPDLGPSCKPSLSSDLTYTCIDLPCSRMNVSRGVTPETNTWSTMEWEKWDVLVAFAGQLYKSLTWGFPELCGLHELFSSMAASAFQCRRSLGAMTSADLRRFLRTPASCT